MKKNKINFFIAGGMGLVGYNLAEFFFNNNINFQASYNKTKPPKKISKFYKRYDFLKFEDCMKATKGVDKLVICAVVGSNVKSMQNDPAKDLVQNITIRANLLRASYRNKVKKIIWISSSTIYQKKNKPIKEKEFDIKKQTYNIYRITGWVYRYIEELCNFYREQLKMNISIIRTTSIYGPHDNFDEEKSHVIPALIKKFSNSKKIDVWGNKNVVRDFVYVEDLINAIFIISKKNNLTVNFSNGKGTSIQELVNTLNKLFKFKKKIRFKNKKLSSVSYRVLDNSLFNRKIKNVKRTNLIFGLKKTINWYKEKIKS